MKCQEVMMYMQRQLDGDLAPKEENELHAHLMHCLDCAQMFERLQALSNELSQLPKVMPPFSLVDAIMPQLLELDKQNVMEAADNVVVFPSKVARIESVEDMPKRSGVSRFKEQFSWKFASGVVAAGLIIGFFAFNMQNPVIDNADGIMSRSSSDSKAVADKRVTATSELNQKEGNNDIAKTQENAASSNEGSPVAPTADLFVKGTETANTATGDGGNLPQATSKAQLEKPGAYSSPATGGDMQTNKVSPSTSAPERLRDPDASIPKSDKIDSKADATTPATGLSVPQSSLEPKSTESPSRKTTPSPTVDPASSDRMSSSQGILSFTVPPGETKLKSTTGMYEATIEEAHVVIRNTLTLEIVFASKHVWQTEDQIKLLEWSKDDKLFYQVISKGLLQTILIDVKEKTEANK
ncbi:zf-HC2 domain-containing protein [Paenibacillus qinlingensis]|uniref:zf-HC2 domain-containing protein n=1 Tax=Paenibacillus qinlingensis TaxID=1837343 RepID=UPI001565A3FC|nr:zf-HC2 domain-containing protein [Paenibacillus qinlingensis]NQX57757.1 zf-HC2 domain-containing protein [Paenibacillus qinlingensis]